jgi:DNA-binding winged helix-turn-helix (wHTH) protein/predicted ATPase
MALSQDFCFGPFRLDVPNARLTRENQPIALQPKAFDVLAYLLENAGRLVTQEELTDAIWPDTIVGDSSLKSCIRQIRQALGDGAREPKFIETVHRRGYRFIGQLARSNEPPSAAEPLPRRVERFESGLPLVGREAELRQLHRALAQALGGQRQLVFVAGGPGSGKTALVECFQRQVCADPHVWIASGQCFEQFGSGEAYLPILEAISELARGVGSHRLLKILSAHAPTWLEQLPALRRQTDGDVPASAAGDATPERMLREMAEALEALTAHTPLILVIEDLHWCDYSTLDMITALARRRHAARLLIVATYRPVEVILSGHPLRAIKQDLQSRGLCEEFSVGLLSPSSVEDYLRARFPNAELPVDLAGLLHGRTEGNALFMVNLVDYWLAQGTLSFEAGQLRTDAEALDRGVPVSIRALIEKQLERLSAAELSVLEGASVAGVEFTAAAAAAASDEDNLHVEACAEVLVRQHHFLLSRAVSEWPDGTASARYRFGHELYHRVVYEHVPPARRRRMHQRLGERLEAAFAGRLDEVAAELVRHFEEARDHRRAAQYLEQAADRAARHFAHREAVAYLRRALAAVENLEPSERTLRELRLRVALGLQLQVTQGFASAEARDAYMRARELCRHAGDSPLMFPVLWGLWLFHKVRSELPRAREMVEELFTLARQRSDAALELQSHQAFAVTHLCLGQPSATVRHMEFGTSLYDPARHHAQTFLFGQDPGVACMAFGAVALWLLGYPQRALEKSREATRLSHQLSQPSTQALALHFAAMVHQCRRDSRAALLCAELTLAIAADQGFSFWHAGGTVMRGWALADSGTNSEGVALLQRGIEAWLATGSVTYQTYFLALLAQLLETAGRFDDALASLETALSLVEQTAEGLFAAELHRLRGDLLLRTNGSSSKSAVGRAEAELRVALEIARQQEARSLELRAAVSLCRLYERQGKLSKGLPLVSQCYEWFTEGFDTPDLQEAAALLGRTGRLTQPNCKK